jgi:hypothetical protein
MNRSPPTKQTASERPISFLLYSPRNGDAPRYLTLTIRPEELVKTDPSRVTAQQTFSEPWVDSFGPGLSTITISGQTGWRRSNDNRDGEWRFRELKQQVFDYWHALRAEYINEGRDPNDVRLVFNDTLNSITATVVPTSFALRRSKSSPLILRYNISLLVVREDVGVPQFRANSRSSAQRGSQLNLTGATSLLGSITKIVGTLQRVKHNFVRAVADPIERFTNDATRLFTMVHSAMREDARVDAGLLSVAKANAQAGLTIFRTLAATPSILETARIDVMELAAEFSNALCVLSNAANRARIYPDYSPLYGASNCSSTSGGRPPSPLRDQNPFFLLLDSDKNSRIRVSDSARGSLGTLASNDVVLAPMTDSALVFHANAVSEGMVIP